MVYVFILFYSQFDYLERQWKENSSFMQKYVAQEEDSNAQAPLTAASAIHPLIDTAAADEILKYTDLIVTFAKDAETGAFKCFPKDFRIDLSRLEEHYLTKRLPVREVDRYIARAIISGNKDEFYSFVGIEGFFLKGILSILKGAVFGMVSNVFAKNTGAPSSDLTELVSLLLLAEVFATADEKSPTESANDLVKYLTDMESEGAAFSYYIASRAKLVQLLIQKETSKAGKPTKIFDNPTLYALTDGAALLNNVVVEDLLTSKGDTVSVALQRFTEKMMNEKKLEKTIGVGARVPLSNLPATVNKDFLLFNLNMYCEKLRGHFKEIFREAYGLAPVATSSSSSAGTSDDSLFVPIELSSDQRATKRAEDDRADEAVVSEMAEKLRDLLGDKRGKDSDTSKSKDQLTSTSQGVERNSDAKETKNKSWLDILRDQIRDTETKLSQLESETDDVSLPRTLVDTLMRDYFDPLTRKQATGVTRVGAGLFQAEVLKGLFDTTGVTKMDGAYVFDGRQVVRSSKLFYEKFYEKFKESPFADKLDFIITTNQRFPGSNDTMTDMVYNVLEKKTSVVIFPKNWNSTIAPTPEQKRSRRLVNLLNLLSSVIVAGNCYNIFDPNGPFAQTGVLPEGFQGLVILPILLQLIPVTLEMFVAYQKGVKVNFVNLPGWFSLPTFGYRAVYENRAKTRNDLFDIAAAGWFTSFILSLLTSIVGLQLTAAASPEEIAALPTLPLVLLKSNPLVMQLFEGQLPAAAAAVAGASKESLVHLHWIAISGLFSMIANTLQLIPTRQTAGSKLLYALKGHGEYYLFSQFIVLVRTLFLAVWTVQSFFTPGNLFLITGKQSMVVTFIFSEVQGSLPETSVSHFLFCKLIRHLLIFNTFQNMICAD